MATMSDPAVVLITGASGNLGSKLRRHFEARFALRLIDRDPRGDPTVTAADLSLWDPGWVDTFRGADVVVHLAADANAQQRWPALIGPNVDATINVFQAAALAGVPPVVYASSNHLFGGYKDD